jgi:hypothetical protein
LVGLTNVDPNDPVDIEVNLTGIAASPPLERR